MASAFSADLVNTLNKEINAGLADPKMKARLADLGGIVLPGSPSDFGKLIVEETEKWAKVVKFSGAKSVASVIRVGNNECDRRHDDGFYRARACTGKALHERRV